MSKPTLQEYYQETIFKELKASLGFKNPHQVPKLQKIVINSAFGADVDKTAREQLMNDIATLAGQRPVFTKARKSISNFKLRQGMPIGVKLTLRGKNMYEFLQRLISIALPVSRDFRGVSSKFDGRGNYTLGVVDHSIFPEIKVENNRGNVGMDITFVTSAEDDKGGYELLKMLGMPFRVHSNASGAEGASE